MVSWMAAGPAFRDMELWTSSFMAVLLSVCASAFTAAAAMLVSIRSYKRMMFYCAAYTLTLCLISFKIASAHNMTFCKVDVSSAMSLDMCGFSLLLSERNTCRRCP